MARVEQGEDTLRDRPSLGERVREQLLRRILSGDLKPGDRIVEMQVARELGTSQAPVREALQSLQALGVVTSTPHRGARVRGLEPEELSEIYEVRAVIEAYAAGRAAARMKGNTEPLEATIADMRRAAQENDLPAFADANAQFHRHVLEASGIATLLEIWRLLDVKARTMLSVTHSGRDLAEIAESHREIVRALASGDARASRRAMRNHILRYRPQL